MVFSVKSTSDLSKSGPTKVLLYAHHGWGKTFQCRHYQERYGKGLIISGEAGLKSIEDVSIDYLPFTSWDGPINEEKGIYSCRAILKMITSGEFQKAGYKWICIDSLTELAERLIEHLEKEHEGSGNGFAMWGDYGRIMNGVLKTIRDLPLHVYITCLAKEEKTPNDTVEYWPHVPGSSVSKKIPALFDHVLCGVRVTEKDDRGVPRVKRYIASDEVSGWHGKTRDPLGRLQAYEECADVTELLARMAMTEDEYSQFKKKGH